MEVVKLIDNLNLWLVYSFIQNYLWKPELEPLLVQLGLYCLPLFSYFRNRNRFGCVKEFHFYRNKIKLNFIRANDILMEHILKDNIQYCSIQAFIEMNFIKFSFQTNLICQLRSFFNIEERILFIHQRTSGMNL